MEIEKEITQETTPTVGENDKVVEETPKVEEIEKEVNTEVEETPTEESETKVEEEETKSYKQSEINEMIKKRLERQTSSLWKKYGVASNEELDNLVKKGTTDYDELKKANDDLMSQVNALTEKLSFISNNIDPSREDDVRTYFKGKELAFSNEELVKALETHKEWRKVEEAKNPTTTISTFGATRQDVVHQETEEEKKRRIFGYDR